MGQRNPIMVTIVPGASIAVRFNERLAALPATPRAISRCSLASLCYPSSASWGGAIDYSRANSARSSMQSKVDSLTPNGGTNQPIGIAWGSQSLTPTAPLDAPAKDANYTYYKKLLMSDGQTG